MLDNLTVLAVKEKLPVLPMSWACFIGGLFCALQQAFNATAVIRHMKQLQLGTSTEGPGPNPSQAHLLLPDEDAGACLLGVSNAFPAADA